MPAMAERDRRRAVAAGAAGVLALLLLCGASLMVRAPAPATRYGVGGEDWWNSQAYDR